MNPGAFRAALLAVPREAREAWVDQVLGLDGVPADGPDLPRGCVPYLPCAVEALLEVVEHAEVGPEDVFVDVGSGLGRAMAVVHLLTGAAAVGIEIQAELVRVARARSTSPRITHLHGDATGLVGATGGTVFFLYCPFSGERLRTVLAALETIARERPIRVGCVDLPLEAPWLTEVWAGAATVYRSACHAG